MQILCGSERASNMRAGDRCSVPWGPRSAALQRNRAIERLHDAYRFSNCKTWAQFDVLKATQDVPHGLWSWVVTRNTSAQVQILRIP